jgi:hypothetical protein
MRYKASVLQDNDVRLKQVIMKVPFDHDAYTLASLPACTAHSGYQES